MFPNPVLDSAAFIHDNSQHVSVPNVSRAAKEIYANMKARKYSIATWKTHPLHPKTANEAAVDWIFLVDLLNFSFWSDLDTVDGAIPHPERYTVEFEGIRYTGYWSLCACVNRALKSGIPITSPRYYGYDASEDDLCAVFRSDTQEEIPLLDERIRVLREAGRVLCEKFDSTFVNCIHQSNKSAMHLMATVVRELESFRDEHVFLGRQVQIYKRAQILIADIWACFESQSLGEFEDIDNITMFADYRVPLALYNLSALSYSPYLLNLLRARTPLAPGSREEIEIRGNSIWAVELIRQEVQRMVDNEYEENGRKGDKMKVNAILLDFYIWDHAKEIQGEEKIMAHLTRSVYY